MRYPLRNIVYEKIERAKNIIDVDLVAELKREGIDITLQGLNRILLHLEILGLISVRWVSKKKKRIEPIEKAVSAPI